MKQIITFNHKGGTGKTTISTAMAMFLSKTHKVLLIDLDSQANATFTFGVRSSTYNISDLEKGYTTFENILHKVNDNLYLIPSNSKLTAINDLKPVLKHQNEFDFIIYDLPPSLGIMAQNVLKYATDVYIPFVCEPYSVDGLLNVVDFIGDRNLRGIAIYMFDKRSKTHKSILTQVKSYCESENIKVFKTIVPRSVDFINIDTSTNKTRILNKLFHEMELI